MRAEKGIGRYDRSFFGHLLLELRASGRPERNSSNERSQVILTAPIGTLDHNMLSAGRAGPPTATGADRDA